jgi:hypothetical protein
MLVFLCRDRLLFSRESERRVSRSEKLQGV